MGFVFKGNIFIGGQIRVKTGLHIGCGEDKLGINAMENSILLDPVLHVPYIPGSSLKGKMRNLLEWALGKVEENGNIHSCNEDACVICRIFGQKVEKRTNLSGPSRILVRDSYPIKNEAGEWSGIKFEGGLPLLETKWENALNRITSAAVPRPYERIPVGSRFEFEFVYSIFDTGENGRMDIENLSHIFMSLRLLEDSFLGRGGSRGSGRIEFHITKPIIIKTLEKYMKNLPAEKVKTPEEPKLENLNIKEIQNRLSSSFKIA
jgi:CRISPR-associated protein Csm3